MIEALLFMSSKAMSIEEIASKLGIETPGAIKIYLDQLKDELDKRNGAIYLAVIDDKYLLTVKEEYIKSLNIENEPDISKGALKILAFISKNNGILQSELVKYFGKATYQYIKELKDKEFIEAKRSGRTKAIFITKKFNEYFVT